MPPNWFDDVRPLIKDSIQELINRLQTNEVQPPTQTFHRLDSSNFMGNTTEFDVAVPGRLLESDDVFNDLYRGEFEESARFIYKHLPDPPEEDGLSERQRISSIERELFEFTGIVLDYVGSVSFDERDFEVAFDEQFEPRFTDRAKSRFLLSLKNTSIDPNTTVDLKTEFQGSPDYLGPYDIESLTIRSLDEQEETGIATFEAPRANVLDSVRHLDASQPNPVVEIILRRRRPYRDIAREIDDNEISPWRTFDFDITPADAYPWQQLTDVVRYIATSIRRCLRLQYPMGTVGFERCYHVMPGWEDYRGIASPVPFIIDFECPDSTTGTRITESRTSEINQLWSTYRRQFRPGDSKFDKPLSRFERMFSRESVEDQLVDCAVGCETTLLKGGSPGGNQYRLGLRVAVLLGERNSQDWSAKRVAEFFRTLYHYRSLVVHEDEPLPDKPNSKELIEVDGEEFIASTFLVLARELYADIIRSYLEISKEKNISINEVTEYIDRKIIKHALNVQDDLFVSDSETESE